MVRFALSTTYSLFEPLFLVMAPKQSNRNQPLSMQTAGFSTLKSIVQSAGFRVLEFVSRCIYTARLVGCL